MIAFKDRPFPERLSRMGDEAEQVFEAVYERAFDRAGLRRPNVKVADLHPYERYRPDYRTSDSYIEVMGFGKDQLLKVKLEKLEAMKFWQLLMPVYVFVWDSHHKRFDLFSLAEIERLCKDATPDRFPEGKWYFAIRAEELFGD